MALTVGSQPGRGAPKSVAEITQDASDYEFNALIPLKYWLRTADTLVKQAQVYMREGDDEMTYFLLFRHAHLFLSHLSTHPQYKKIDPVIRAVEKEVLQNLKVLDLLKPKIARRHEEYMQMEESRQRRRKEDAARRRISDDPDPSTSLPGLHAEQLDLLSGHENADIAAWLAGQEFSRRAPSRRAYPTASSVQTNNHDLAAQMQLVRNRVQPQDGHLQDDMYAQREPRGIGFNYPNVPMQKQHRQPPAQPSGPAMPQSRMDWGTVQGPALPPKPDQERLPQPSGLPPRPEKVTSSSRASKIDGEPNYVFAAGATLENGTTLRTIFLPRTLRTTFLRMAHKNTMRNLETCAFLAGTLRANALFVSALVVPKQAATSDTCEMTDESELFDYVDQHDLMVLGWIHTHPTQTCFMSSRDLHTHSGYQMMLAESVAIVCAPSKGDTSHGGDWGVYRLTDPPGKMAILQCDKPGIFHPHDVDNIYTDAMRPGHVMEISDMDFEIVDLR